MSKLAVKFVIGLLLAAIVFIGSANVAMADDDCGTVADPNAALPIE
jgi:hypothetical protein